ncbi:response regulator [Synechococcus sp. Nb3U1]|uniref:response regulator n=1 Tax=Synechococcus sp. Nb3U1 TaxID=1914529 RepID=UPI001F2E578C|nr:response regulator [Synechococcus sp. Nb3U1]MCF2970233.1 response regulator [Synechococcus sp. Nb3U1]
MSQQVLLVEDDPNLCYILSLLLQQENTEFVAVTSARNAISHCQISRPDLIILDLELAGDEGFALLEWLDQHPPAKPIPVLIYTACDVEYQERLRLESHFTQVFTKGRISPMEFQERVHQLLAQAS